MSEARALLEAGERPPFWCLAESQTAGRGRRGRGWESPPGNFSATLVMMPRPGLAPVACIFAVGVALHVAFCDLAPALAGRLRLKWPNDLLLDGGKLAGVLVEAEQGVLLIGIGINLRHAPQAPVYGRPAARLADAGVEIAPQALAERLSPLILHWTDMAAEGGMAELLAAWQVRGPQKGAEIDVSMLEQTLHGRYEGVDAHGRLLLRTEEGVVPISAGDVSP